MTQDHLDHAAVARLTVDLVSAYCATLDIEPHELAGLVAYVGSVVGRPPARQEVCPYPADPAKAPPGQEEIVITAEPPPMMASADDSARIICLADYRAWRSAMRPGSAA